jgi:uncharacterized protein YwgA
MEGTVAEEILSRIFHQLGFSEIKMNDFQDRLKYQKIVYLIQKFGLSLGYGYSWYVRGPYSPDLTKNLFSISKNPTIFSEGCKLRLNNEEKVISRIDEFKNLLEENINDPLFLEILASMVFIKDTYQSKNVDNEELKEILLELKPRLKQESNLDLVINKACSKISAF